MTKPTDAERCLERAAQLRTSPTIGDAIPHFAARTPAERDRPIPPALGEFAWQERQGLLDEVKRLREALDKIASWGEGPVVTESFDSPVPTRIARAALAPQERT